MREAADQIGYLLLTKCKNMIIDKQLLDSLTKQAKNNLRLRQAYDLRTTPNDLSQRILNAVEPGTVQPIHRHKGSTETITCLRGKCVQYLYDGKYEPLADEDI